MICSGYYFITPIWGNEIPEMLKDCINKVKKKEMVPIHIVTRKSIKSILTNIKQAYVLPPRIHLTANIVYAQERTAKKFLCTRLINPSHWQNLGNISPSIHQRHKRYLEYLSPNKDKVFSRLG